MKKQIDKQFYLDYGFKKYATLHPSDKYKQGIDIDKEINFQEDDQRPAIYILMNTDNQICKIGETQNLNRRFFKGYRHIANVTNDKIRTYIKGGKNLEVYIFFLDKMESTILGYNVVTSFTESLELALLKEYKTAYGQLPMLNTILK